MESKNLSEQELSRMLDARELEKDNLRKQTSHNFTITLVIASLLLAAAIFFFPSAVPNPKTNDSLQHAKNKILENKNLVSQHGLESSPKSLTQPLNTEDLKFAVDIITFGQSPELKKTSSEQAQETLQKKP